jgi:hypothetical protein
MVKSASPFWKNDLIISRNISARFNKQSVHFLEIPENFQQSQNINIPIKTLLSLPTHKIYIMHAH